MLAKVCSVFTGYYKKKTGWVGVEEDGEVIDWCNAAFSVPGTADMLLLKVNQKEVEPDELKPYRANFLLVDFRFDKKYNTYKGYIVKVFPSEAAMNADPLGVPDELRDDRKAAAPAPAQK